MTALNATADIGNNGEDQTEALRGYLKDVKVYNRALNAVEISDLYYTCQVNENKALALLQRINPGRAEKVLAEIKESLKETKTPWLSFGALVIVIGILLARKKR